jgi:ubiquinone/menaquinone biosynthesis C-methylase UbiE
MPNNYNSVAFFYDALSRLVFGKATLRSQTWLLDKIPPQAQILIIGGGTGWILEELAAVQSTGLRITYIESAIKMLNKSKTRNIKNNKVVFIHQDAQTYVPDTSYDIIITPFLLDNFSTDGVKNLIAHYYPYMDANGLWLVSDFQITPAGKLWQKPLLRTMYTFFRWVSHVEVKDLPEIDNSFKSLNFYKQNSMNFYGGFIQSAIYQKYAE